MIASDSDISKDKEPVVNDQLFSFNSVLEKAHQLNLAEQLLLLVSLCYIAGFVITNIHFALHGIVSLELLRPRYVAAGFLFLVFLGAVFIPLKIVLTSLSNYQSKPVRHLFVRGLGEAATLYLPLLSIAAILDIIGIPTNPGPVIIPKNLQVSPTALLSFLVYCFVPVLLLVVTGATIKKLFKKQSPQISVVSELGKFLSGLTGMYFWLMILLILAFAATPSFLSGWFKFFVSSFLIYLFAVVTILMAQYNHEEIKPSEDSGFKSVLSYVYVSIFIILVYLLSAYPNAPQQFGGGSLLPVKVTTSNDKINQLLTAPDTNLYLMDRTSDASIFELVNTQTNSQQFIQVSNSEINAISYESH